MAVNKYVVPNMINQLKKCPTNLLIRSSIAISIIKDYICNQNSLLKKKKLADRKCNLSE